MGFGKGTGPGRPSGSTSSVPNAKGGGRPPKKPTPTQSTTLDRFFLASARITAEGSDVEVVESLEGTEPAEPPEDLNHESDVELADHAEGNGLVALFLSISLPACYDGIIYARFASEVECTPLYCFPITFFIHPLHSCVCCQSLAIKSVSKRVCRRL